MTVLLLRSAASAEPELSEVMRDSEDCPNLLVLAEIMQLQTALFPALLQISGWGDFD